MLSGQTRRVYLKSGNKYAKTWGKKQRNKSPQHCQKLYIKPVGELDVGLVPWTVRSLNDWICKRTHVQTPPWNVHSSKPSMAAEVPGQWHFLGLTGINSYNKAQYWSCLLSCRRKHTQTHQTINLAMSHCKFLRPCIRHHVIPSYMWLYPGFIIFLQHRVAAALFHPGMSAAKHLHNYSFIKTDI